MIKKRKRETTLKAEDLLQVVVFELDGQEYAVPISDLREVIKLRGVKPVPNSPDCIRGILDLRGEIVVVVDLGSRFHRLRKNEVKQGEAIIAEVGGKIFGVVVDRVTEVLYVPKKSIKPAPELLSSKINAEYTKGVVFLPSDSSAQVDDEPSEVGREGSKSTILIYLDLPTLLKD